MITTEPQTRGPKVRTGGRMVRRRGNDVELPERSFG